MEFNVTVTPHILHFKQPAITSRGAYTIRKIWLVRMSHPSCPDISGWGECAPLIDLNTDGDFVDQLFGNSPTRGIYSVGQAGNLYRHESGKPDSVRFPVSDNFAAYYDGHGDIILEKTPSLRFALETAYLHWVAGGKTTIFDTDFSRGNEGIKINGLIWMGTFDEMRLRIEDKLEQGFDCVKLKIGGIDFDRELDLIKNIRRRFSRESIELRLDANGAFTPDNALQRLDRLSPYQIHSIEQPIRPRQPEAMASLCQKSPIPIALDEDLHFHFTRAEKAAFLADVKPQYIVIKPTLCGGITGTEEWVEEADKAGIKQWITSALESNIGLNAIAQLTAKLYPTADRLPQGLGTGQLFTDNFSSPLIIRKDRLWIEKSFHGPLTQSIHDCQ